VFFEIFPNMTINPIINQNYVLCYSKNRIPNQRKSLFGLLWSFWCF